ncbi:MAG: polysaccharide pyruvyl transferase family protein, partial [Candidatus Limnocylindrus sp.]
VATIRAEELYEQADFQPLNKNHAQRLARMTSFLERNGLKHIHQPGESGAAFDARMDATKLPPAVRPVSTISALAGVVRRRIARGA